MTPTWLSAAATILVPLMVAVITLGGVWLGISIRARAARLARQDTLNRRNIRLINYGRQLQMLLEKNKVDYPEWPDDLYDTEGTTNQ